VDPDLKSQLIAVMLSQFGIYFGCLLLFIVPIFGTLDRIIIYIGYAWLIRNLLASQHIHLLIFLSILKRLRLMNKGLRQIDNLDFNIVEDRRFIKRAVRRGVKIFHHLHHTSEIASATSLLVSSFQGNEFPDIQYKFNFF
jgi:hypothetical protein